MKVLTGPQPPLQPAAAQPPRHLAMLVGGGLGLFALAALAAALMLKGPEGTDRDGPAENASKTPSSPPARSEPG